MNVNGKPRIEMSNLSDYIITKRVNQLIYGQADNPFHTNVRGWVN